MQTEFLLSLINDQSPQPSIFELVVIDSIQSMFQPALRHIVRSVVATTGNESTMSEHFDTIFAFHQLAVDGYHIFSERSSTFVEKLYGMVRVSGSEGLSDWQKIGSMLYLALFPHFLGRLKALCIRIEASFEESSEIDASRGSDEPSEVPFVRWKVKLQALGRLIAKYSIYCIGRAITFLQGAEGCSQVIFRLMFALGRSPFHHPLFALLGMQLRKERHLSTLSRGAGTGSSASPIPQPISNRSSNWQLRVLFTILFALRGLDFIINSDFSSDHITTKLRESSPAKLPPPPAPSPIATGGICPPANSTHCALCQKPKQHPCAATSGYVFCFSCISNFVQRENRCPITHLPCTIDNLIKLYDPAE